MLKRSVFVINDAKLGITANELKQRVIENSACKTLTLCLDVEERFSDRCGSGVIFLKEYKMLIEFIEKNIHDVVKLDMIKAKA